MNKVAGWQPKFYDALLAALTEPFAWYDNDCVTFAARMLDLQYGTDIIGRIEAGYKYSGEAGAMRMIAKNGGMEALVTEVLGVEPLPPAHLTTGDVVMYDYGQENFPHALAVHEGHSLFSPAEGGVIKIDLGRALKGWRL